MGEPCGLFELRDRFRLVSVDLRGVEHCKTAGVDPASATTILLAIVAPIAALERLPQHDGRAVLALADLRVLRLPLAVRAPDAFGKARCIGSSP